MLPVLVIYLMREDCFLFTSNQITLNGWNHTTTQECLWNFAYMCYIWCVKTIIIKPNCERSSSTDSHKTYMIVFNIGWQISKPAKKTKRYCPSIPHIPWQAWSPLRLCMNHETFDVIKWEHVPCYWPFVPVTRNFDVFFDLHLIKGLSKQLIRLFWNAIALNMTSGRHYSDT